MSYSIFDGTMVDMAWPELEKAIKEGSVVLLPTGVIEEHGPHMSIGVDAYLSYLVCKLTKYELERRNIKALIAPPCYWGINNVTGSFPGSFNVREETMKCLIHDILASLKRWGVTYVFNINWHDDYRHCRALIEAISEAGKAIGIKAYSIISGALVGRLGLEGDKSSVLTYESPFPLQSGARSGPKGLDIHAGSGETGTMVKYFPDEVDVGLARRLKATDLTHEDFRVWRKGWDDAMKITPLGYLGDPANFDAESGKQYVEGLCKILAGVIETFLKGNYSPENHVRKES